MNNYIVDTNLFFNMEAGMGLGNTTLAIFDNLIKALPKAAANQEKILMPPAIVREIETFFEKPEENSQLTKLLGFVTVKSPEIGSMNLPSRLVSDLIEDYRTRAFRGMKVAEEEIVNAANSFMGKEALAQKEFQISTGKIITKLRERYRTATRVGTLDSQADFDLIMLAKETDGVLISTDEGVVSWGRRFGAKEMSPVVFGKKMQAYL